VDAVVFDITEGDTEKADQMNKSADRVLSPSDIRQLTVYAEILKRQRNLAFPPALAIVYPFVGEGEMKVSRAVTWNGSDLWLVPLRVDSKGAMSEVMPNCLEMIDRQQVKAS